MGESLSRSEKHRLHGLTKWKTKEHEGTPYPCAQFVLDGYVELTQQNRHHKVEPYVISSESISLTI